MLEADIASPFRIIIADDDPVWAGICGASLNRRRIPGSHIL